VRELKNAVARAISIGAGAESAGPASVPASAAVSGRIDLSVPLKEARDRMCDLFEEQYLRLALTETGGNVSQAARLAGVNRKFIQRAVRRFGLRADDDEE
jgi:DNA-binding NtrC family response regulator